MTKKIWDTAYKKKLTPWRNDPFVWLKKELKPVKNKSALDLGCGTGEASKILTQVGYKVTGVDFSKEALKEVLKKIEAIYWDLEKIDRLEIEKGSYDLILDSKVLAFIRNKNRYLKTVSALLKKNGRFIIQGFLRSPKKHICLKAKDLELIRKFFDVTKTKIIIGKDTDFFVYVLKKKSE